MTSAPSAAAGIHNAREFDALRQWLEHRPIEGVVWHHQDGRMVKLKRSDFFKSPRPPRVAT